VVPGLPPHLEFSVLVHELAHELLHRDDRDRELSKTIRETEAEAVSFVVCLAIGLDASAQCSDYIHAHGGHAATLSSSVGRIQRAVTAILSALERPRIPRQLAFEQLPRRG
jgi:hypothetical protein